MTRCPIPLRIAPMADDERNLVLSSWMRTSQTHRSEMARTMADGSVLVAHAEDGLALGWIAYAGNLVHYGWVRDGYRDLGVMRELWSRAGHPATLAKHADTRVKRIMKALLGAAQKEAS